jgi:hypothetical protein
MIEGWTSRNLDINVYKVTIYNAKKNIECKFFEWVPFNEFTDIK